MELSVLRTLEQARRLREPTCLDGNHLGGGELATARTAAAAHDLAPILGLHPLTESTGLLAFTFTGLIGPFHVMSPPR